MATTVTAMTVTPNVQMTTTMTAMTVTTAVLARECLRGQHQRG